MPLRSGRQTFETLDNLIKVMPESERGRLMKAKLRSWGKWLVREVLRYPFPLLFEGAWSEHELAAAHGRITPMTSRQSPVSG